MALLHLEGLFLFYIIMITKMIVFSSKIGYFITFSSVLCFNLVNTMIGIEENSPMSVIGNKYKNVDLFMSGISPVLQDKIVKGLVYWLALERRYINWFIAEWWCGEVRGNNRASHCLV